MTKSHGTDAAYALIVGLMTTLACGVAWNKTHAQPSAPDPDPGPTSQLCCELAGDWCATIPICEDLTEDYDHCTQAEQLKHQKCDCAGTGCVDDGLQFGEEGCGFEQAAECVQNPQGGFDCHVNHIRNVGCGRKRCHNE